MVYLLQWGGERVEYKRSVVEKEIGKDGTHAKAL